MAGLINRFAENGTSTSASTPALKPPLIVRFVGGWWPWEMEDYELSLTVFGCFLAYPTIIWERLSG